MGISDFFGKIITFEHLGTIVHTCLSHDYFRLLTIDTILRSFSIFNPKVSLQRFSDVTDNVLYRFPFNFFVRAYHYFVVYIPTIVFLCDLYLSHHYFMISPAACRSHIVIVSQYMANPFVLLISIPSP